MAEVDIKYFIVRPDFYTLAPAQTTVEVSECFGQVMEYYTFVFNCVLDPLWGQLW
jgi:hypothetical protein